MNTYTFSEKIEPDHELLNKYSPFLTQLLVNRNIYTLKDADAFINPNYDDSYDPFLLYGMDIFIERLHLAITENQKITIYADYDADGIPGAVILSTLLDALKYENYDIYIPHRHSEGYGIHISALEKIKASGTQLIITIDVGITAHEAAAWTIKNSIDMMITDHHLPLKNPDGGQSLPKPLVLINPKQELCNYPDPMLCGCGVIFKCIQAFIQKHGVEFKIPLGWEKWLLDMVGISTISDMVPLLDENRIFSYYGIKVMKKTRRIGLKELIWNAGINQQYLNEEDVAFGITPKINAASRMSHPEDALAVFLAKDSTDAKTKVKHLNTLNNNRKKLVAQTMKSAYKKMEGREVGGLIVIGSPDWKAGILGLVASKLVEKYKVPAFVWSEENGEIKGSCRSYNENHLVEIMSAAEESSFIGFGGHAEAGGFSCYKKEIHFLQIRLDKAILKYQQEKPRKETQEKIIDAELNLDGVIKKIFDEMNQLAPFGIANPKPLFILKNIVPIEVKQFGKTKEHIEIHFENSANNTLRALTFFKTPESFSKVPEIGKPIDLLAHMEYSVFMGKHELRLKIVDIT